ncbi:hypothetical protein DFH28DRAFT_96652 [Melampsora americana]|nr:hypothetical protein DFH28DRAFT_96652 [Melampsora americana]
MISKQYFALIVLCLGLLAPISEARNGQPNHDHGKLRPLCPDNKAAKCDKGAAICTKDRQVQCKENDARLQDCGGNRGQPTCREDKDHDHDHDHDHNHGRGNGNGRPVCPNNQPARCNNGEAICTRDNKVRCQKSGGRLENCGGNKNSKPTCNGGENRDNRDNRDNRGRTPTCPRGGTPGCSKGTISCSNNKPRCSDGGRVNKCDNNKAPTCN